MGKGVGGFNPPASFSEAAAGFDPIGIRAGGSEYGGGPNGFNARPFSWRLALPGSAWEEAGGFKPPATSPMAE